MSCTTPISMPGIASPSRTEFFGVRWLLERRADGVFCVAMDDAGLLFEGFVGLPDQAKEKIEARLELRAPENAVDITLANELVLTPKSKLAGWLPVPFNQRLVVNASFGDAPVVTLGHPELRLAWREGEGYRHAQDESFRPDVTPLPRDRRRMWLRVQLENRSAELVRPKRLPLELQSCDIVAAHGMAFGPKVLWDFAETSTVRFAKPQSAEPNERLLSPDFQRATDRDRA